LTRNVIVFIYNKSLKIVENLVEKVKKAK